MIKKFASIAIGLSLLGNPSFAGLKEAQTALVQKNYTLAIQEARSIRGTHPVDAILIEARSLLELEQPAKAEALIRPLVNASPKFYAARMLLGSALMAQGKKISGEFQYRRALDVAKNDKEAKMARQVLRNVQSRRSFSLNGTFGLVPSTNVGKATTNETVKLTFGESIITSDKAQSGTGVHGSISVARNIFLENGYKLSLGVSGYERRYKNEQFNQNSRSFSINLNDMRKSRNTAGMFLRYSRYSFGGDPYSSVIATGISTNYCMTRDCKALRTSLQFDKTTLVDASAPESTGLKANITLDLLAKSNFRLSFNSELQRRTSDNVNYDYKGVTTGLRGVYVPQNSPWVITGGVNRSLKKWSDIAPLFTTRRFDLAWEYSLSIKNPNLSYFGFTPVLDYSYSDRKSSIEFYDITSHDFFIGVTNAF